MCSIVAVLRGASSLAVMKSGMTCWGRFLDFHTVPTRLIAFTEFTALTEFTEFTEFTAICESVDSAMHLDV